MALATDYDCWHEEEEDVSVDAVIEVLKKNSERAKEILARAASKVPAEHNCIATDALKFAIMTDPSTIPDNIKRDLEPIIGKYIK